MVVTAKPDFEAQRHAMVVSQLRTNAVDDARVIAAMATVPREAFVPATTRAQSYSDTGVALGGGRALNPPMATGRLFTELGLQPDERVLVIGSAYAAAVAAHLAEAVVLVESDPARVAAARESLAGYPAVTIVEGELAAGAAEAGPFEAILIDGAVEHLPDAIVEQLKPGGRIATGIVDRGVTRLATGTRTSGGFGLPAFADVECAVLPGFARATAFSF